MEIICKLKRNGYSTWSQSGNRTLLNKHITEPGSTSAIKTQESVLSELITMEVGFSLILNINGTIFKISLFFNKIVSEIIDTYSHKTVLVIFTAL